MEWLPLWTILIAGTTAVPVPASAADAASQPYALAVIVGGGRTEADAKRAINEFRNTDGGKITPADGYPKIISSGDVEGAPPNTYMAILGYCDPGSADYVNRIVRAISTGAYSMPIAGKYEHACPTLAPELLQNNDPQPKKKRR